MSFATRFVKALKSPYPIAETVWEEIRGLIIAALIVSGILFIFEPFGLHYYSGSKGFVALAFGAVTFVVGILYFTLIKTLFRKKSIAENQSLGAWIVHLLGLIIFIAMGNFLFTVCYLNSDFSTSVFLVNLLSTAVIGIFPITLFGLQNQITLERRNTQKAKEIYEQLKTQNSKKRQNQKVIIAIQAMENYIHIFEKDDDQLLKITKRQTLSSAMKDPSFQGLTKCHRSFLYNPLEVTEVTGNAQGLKLTMSHSECPIIPVSRSFIETVRRAMNA